MQKIIYAFLACLLLIAQLNHSTGMGESSTGNNRRKQKTNCQGTLIKYTGEKLASTTKTYSINNISIDRLTDQIRVFEVPGIKPGPLVNDPRKGTIIHLDLKEITKIEIPDPERKWKFKRNDRAQELEFIELKVSFCRGGKTTLYIIEFNRRLYFDEIKACRPIEMDMPINEIKELVIEYCCARTEEQQKEEGKIKTDRCTYSADATPAQDPTKEQAADRV